MPFMDSFLHNRRAFVLGLLLLAGGSVLAPGAAAAGHPSLAPSAAQLRAAGGTFLAYGASVTLPVQATGVPKLGAATVVVGYDPARLRPAACRRNPAFDLGLCNLQFDRNGDGTIDAVRFNVVSLQGLSGEAASPLTLVDITWTAVGQPTFGVTTTLTLDVLTFTDTNAVPVGVSARNGQVRFLGGARSTGLLPYISRKFRRE